MVLNTVIAEVYPRVGGGTSPIDLSGVPASGLSPRGRGNQASSISGLTLSRSIPAWAGEP